MIIFILMSLASSIGILFFYWLINKKILNLKKEIDSYHLVQTFILSNIIFSVSFIFTFIIVFLFCYEVITNLPKCCDWISFLHVLLSSCFLPLSFFILFFFALKLISEFYMFKFKDSKDENHEKKLIGISIGILSTFILINLIYNINYSIKEIFSLVSKKSSILTDKLSPVFLELNHNMHFHIFLISFAIVGIVVLLNTLKHPLKCSIKEIISHSWSGLLILFIISLLLLIMYSYITKDFGQFIKEGFKLSLLQ